MNYNMVLATSLTAIIAIVAISISIGTLVATSIDTEVDKDVSELKTDNDKIWNQFGIVETNTNTKISNHVHEEYLTIENFDTFKEEFTSMKGDIDELQLAIKTTNENFIALPETPPPKQSFHLKVTDVKQKLKSTFGINEIAYFTANADDSKYSTATYKIFAPSGGEPLVDSSIGIPDKGSFTMYWSIPATPESGTYTFTLSDKGFLDSITFQVE